MLKKILFIVLCLAVLGLTACGPSEEEKQHAKSLEIQKELTKTTDSHIAEPKEMPF